MVGSQLALIVAVHAPDVGSGWCTMLRSPVPPPWMSKFCDVMFSDPPLTFMAVGSSRVTVHRLEFNDVPRKSSSPGQEATAVVASTRMVAFWCLPPASVAVSVAV